PDLFAQFAPQRLFRLLVVAQKTAGNPPSAAAPKDVTEQQHATPLVERDRAGAYGETRLRHPHAPTHEAARHVAPEEIKKPSQHLSTTLQKMLAQYTLIQADRRSGSPIFANQAF